MKQQTIPKSARKHPWTAAEDKLLGKYADAEVARRVDRKLSEVRNRRLQLGIRSWNAQGQPDDALRNLFENKSTADLLRLLGWSVRRINARRAKFLRQGSVGKRSPAWSPPEEALLGTMSDEKVAEKIGRSPEAVKARRNAKRILLYVKLWQPADEKILGTRPDKKIAELLGRPVIQVSARRRKLDAPYPFRRKPWTKRDLALLGKYPDEDVARMTGHTVLGTAFKRNQRNIRKADAILNHWRKDEDKLLGAKSDDEVGKALGRSAVSVMKRRQRLGIPNQFSQHRYWTPEEVGLLGKLSDGEVARQIGRKIGEINLKRRSLGIPRFGAKHSKGNATAKYLKK